MVYLTLVDVYRHFMACYAVPTCCGQVHWSPGDLADWLLSKTPWDGDFRHLSPALIERAAREAMTDHRQIPTK